MSEERVEVARCMDCGAMLDTQELEVINQAVPLEDGLMCPECAEKSNDDDVYNNINTDYDSDY